jgi:predicted transcriptional regulator YdeE
MYDEPITITDISAQAYLSPSYFSSLFRIFTGFTVKNYLNRYRSNLPVGLVGRKFPACKRAVFNTTLNTIWSDEFWHTFYAKWLHASGYTLPDSQLKEICSTFEKHPDLEIYPDDWKDENSIMQIYANE